MEKTKKNDFTINTLDGDNHQAVAFGMDGDKYKEVREDTSLSRFSIQIRKVTTKIKSSKRKGK